MTDDTDWNDPVARYNLVEAVGQEEYNRRINAYLDANPIRPVSTRFGTLYAVGRTLKAFSTRKEAEDFLAAVTDNQQTTGAAS